MSIWLTLPVDVQPNVVLIRWRVFLRDNGKMHFVGLFPTWNEPRVSSAVEVFDPLTRRGVTQSGRVYLLSGSPGFDIDAMSLWDQWSRAKGWKNFRDVTPEVLVGLHRRPSDA